MQLIASGERLTRSEYEARYGADPKDVKQVQAFARAHGLKVSSVNRSARTVMLSGTAAAFNKAFQVDLAHYQCPRGDLPGTHRVRVHSSSLEGVILASTASTTGLRRDHTFASRPTVQPPGARQGVHIGLLHAAPGGAALRFPGRRQRPGPDHRHHRAGRRLHAVRPEFLLQRPRDLPGPQRLGGVRRRRPEPAHGRTNGPDTEVMLDIEVAGSVAPGAKIAVYFAPNTDSGFLDAINQAVADKQNNPSVISISWGGPESTWTAQSLQSYNSALAGGVGGRRLRLRRGR